MQSRLINPLLSVALGAIVLGSMLASSVYVRTVNATTDVNRVQDQECAPARQTNQDSASTVPNLLPPEVMNKELKALNGSTFRLADYQGKVVLVNLWATWCGPCRSEIPNLAKVSQEFRARGVEVIGLTNEDPQTQKKNVRAFVREFKITYQIGWGDQDFAVALMQGTVKNNIPQTFVISRDGRVLTRFIGFNRAETPRKLHQAIEDALIEK